MYFFFYYYFVSAFFFFFFFFNDTATTEIYTPLYTLSLHDALPISGSHWSWSARSAPWLPTRSRSEEHTSELQSHSGISYAVFCLKKKKIKKIQMYITISMIVLTTIIKTQIT